MSSSDERLWWCILLDADVLSEIASNQGDGALAVRYMKVGNIARRTLRDKFGINLDTLSDKARDQVQVLAEAELEKEQEEERLHQEIDRALANARGLLQTKD